MADLTPNNREEYWLKGMVDGQTTLEPNKRREYWYKEIVDAIGSGGGGGGTGVLAVTMDENGALDKTWQEIHDATVAVLSYTEDDSGSLKALLVEIYVLSGDYGVKFVDFAEGTITANTFIASSADGYPVYSEE